MAKGQYNAGGITLTSGGVAELQLDANGLLKTTVSGGASGGTSAVDQSAYTAGSSSFTPVGGVFETTPSTLTNGQNGAIGLDSSRNTKIVGNVANDAADAGSPLKIGGYAETSLSTATLVADADRVNAIFGIDGVQITRPHTNLEDIVTGTASATGTSDTSVIAAVGAGINLYITDICIANTGSSTSLISLKDASAGTTLWQTIAPATGGSNIHFTNPLKMGSNKALFFAAGTGSTTIYVSAIGFKSKV